MTLTRRGLADDLALLEARSHKALGAGVATERVVEMEMVI